MRLFGVGRVGFSMKAVRRMHHIIRFAMQITGLYRIGHRHALDLRVEHNPVHLPDLPAAFDGFRILHISDTHIDGNPELLPVLIEKVKDIPCDLCVFTGDFRDSFCFQLDLPQQLSIDLFKHIDAPAYAILGNHDNIQMVPGFEAAGIRVLLNEHVKIERGGESLFLLGIDDPHHYKTDDLTQALAGTPDKACRILLAHSPQAVPEAAAAGVSLYLCGHTHGGQICRPDGQPLLKRSRRQINKALGAWEYEGMPCYTSRGAGTSSIAVRFNCPPEITLHTLKKSTD